MKFKDKYFFPKLSCKYCEYYENSSCYCHISNVFLKPDNCCCEFVLEVARCCDCIFCDTKTGECVINDIEDMWEKNTYYCNYEKR